MCGIFGAIKSEPDAKINYGILRCLVVLNRERGTDALGFFNARGHIKKLAKDPSEALCDEKMNKWLSNCAKHDNWFVVGHTRNGTRGANTNANAHPYRYGKVTGAHNGCVSAPCSYAVDSQYLFDLLNQHDGDYQKALDNVSGYWGLVWAYKNNLFLAVHNCELALTEVDGVWYFSSDYQHLDAATGEHSYPLIDGEVVRFDAKGDSESSEDRGATLEPFVSSASADWSICKAYTGTGNKWQNTHEYDGTAWEGDTLVTKEYDADWRDAWLAYQEEYSSAHTSSIHNLSEEEFLDHHGN